MKTLEYVKVKELAVVGDIHFELGHYVDSNGKESVDKVYGFMNKTGAKGKEYYNIVVKLGIDDFNEMVRKIGEITVKEECTTETIVNSTFTYGTKPKRKATRKAKQ